MTLLGAACTEPVSETTRTPRPTRTTELTVALPTTTPTLAVQADGIHVFPSSGPSAWVVSGLIQNQSTETVSAVEIELSIFDLDKNMPVVQTFSLPARLLSPEEISPFRLELHGLTSPGEVSIRASGYQSAEDSMSLQLEMEERARWSGTGSEVSLLGVLRNPYDDWLQLDDCSIIVIDSEGRVVDLDLDPDTYQILPPFSETSFLAHLDRIPQGQVSFHADGHPVAVLPTVEVRFPEDPSLLETDQGWIFLLGSVHNPQTDPISMLFHLELYLADQIIIFASHLTRIPLAPGETRLIRVDGFSGLPDRLDALGASLEELDLQLDIDRWTHVSEAEVQPLEIEVTGLENTGSTLLLQGWITNPTSHGLVSPTALLAVYQTEGKPLTAAEVTIAQEIQGGESLRFVLDLPLPRGSDLNLAEFDLQAFALTP